MRRLPPGARRPPRPARPGVRSGCRPSSRRRSSSSSGRHRSRGPSAQRSTPSSTRGERRLAEPLGEAAAERWRRAGAGGDLIVPVPVHAERARERGYDQAVLLAEVVGRAARAADRAAPRAATAHGRPVRARSSPTGRRTSQGRSACARGDDRAMQERSRSLADPGRRRDDDRRDAGGLRRRPDGGRRAGGVGADGRSGTLTRHRADVGGARAYTRSASSSP